MNQLAEATSLPSQTDAKPDDAGLWLEGVAHTLDSLDVPAWVIDPMSRRLHRNCQEHTTLDRVLRVDGTSQAEVQPIDEKQVLIWHNAITRAQTKGFASVSLDSDAGPCVIRMRLLEFSKRVRRQDVLIVIYGPRDKSCNAEMLRAYSKANHLTDSELKILDLLINNVAPAKIAERREVSEWTVRAQIKSILNKTGTHSMRDLMLAVSTLPPAA